MDEEDSCRQRRGHFFAILNQPATRGRAPVSSGTK
jgi:hypothetical protein